MAVPVNECGVRMHQWASLIDIHRLALKSPKSPRWQRSAVRAIFELLNRIRCEQSLQFLLIGGWALQAYGYARQTLDVDCLCAMKDSESFGRSLTEAGFERFDRVGAFQRFRHRLNPFLVIDLMLVDGPTFTNLWSPAEEFQIDETSIKVPTFEHLIALKLHAAKKEGRSKRDLEDIAARPRPNPEWFTLDHPETPSPAAPSTTPHSADPDVQH